MMRAKLSTCALLFAVSQSLFAADSLPDAGMSMKAVEAKFGQPQHRDPAVGHPPITRWDYPDFVVVFERSTVVHSMHVIRGNAAAATPAPAPQPAPAPAPAAPAPAAAAPTAPAPAAPATSAPASPVPAASTPGTPAPDAAADAMNKAAEEKSAAGTDAAPAAPAPAPEPGYTFDPETGRIIVK